MKKIKKRPAKIATLERYACFCSCGTCSGCAVAPSEDVGKQTLVGSVSSQATNQVRYGM